MMLIIAKILTILASIECLEWLLRNAFALKVWRACFHLTPKSPTFDQPGQPPLISVIVAAKDEEDNIETCLTSLLAQDYPNLELICVNDRSADRTAEIVERLAATDSRLKLLNIDELPKGWCGKNHAMQRGIEASGGEWIFMTDADCKQISNKTLSIAMQYACDHKVDMLSVLPTLEMKSFWERFLQPICGGVLMVWFRPEKVNNPKKRHAYANGQFMLICRNAYAEIGTHQAIKGSLIEDMDLARRIKAADRNLRMVPSEGLLQVRMYTTREQIIKGWVRIFVGSFYNLPRLAGALGVLTFKGLTVFITAAIGLLMYAAGSEPSNWWLACGLIGAVGSVAELIMTFRYYRQAGSKGRYGLLYPIGCAMVACILVKAMFTRLTRREIVWRDTVYSAG